AADPADHSPRSGQIESCAPAGDRGEGGEPESVGVLVNGGCQLSLDLTPGILEILAYIANLPRNSDSSLVVRPSGDHRPGREGSEGGPPRPPCKPRRKPGRAFPGTGHALYCRTPRPPTGLS